MGLSSLSWVLRLSPGKLRSSPLPCKMLDFSFAAFEALRLKDYLCFSLRFLKMIITQKQHKISNLNETFSSYQNIKSQNIKLRGLSVQHLVLINNPVEKTKMGKNPKENTGRKPHRENEEWR